MSERAKPALLYVLATLIFIEGLALLAGAIYLVVEIFIGDPKYVGTAVAYAVTALIFAALVIALARFVLLARPWIRGATVCIAVLQLLLAYSIIITNAPALGWIILVPAVALLVLLFTRPVLSATARAPRED